jgi:hypothetical protein
MTGTGHHASSASIRNTKHATRSYTDIARRKRYTIAPTAVKLLDVAVRRSLFEMKRRENRKR